MTDTVRIHFQFALWQYVHVAVHPGQVYRIVGRVYEEREVMGPCVWYRLERAGIHLSASEPDLLPAEDPALEDQACA